MIAGTPGKSRRREGTLKLIALLPVAGFVLLAAMAGLAVANGATWPGEPTRDFWIAAAVLWAGLGAALLVLLTLAVAAPLRFGRWAAPPTATIVLSVGNLATGGVGVYLGHLAGYGRFPGIVVDAILLIIVTVGFLLCGIAWTGTEAVRGRREWLARGLALVNGGIALALAVAIFLAVIVSPPIP